MRDPSQRPFAWKLVLAVVPIGLVFAALTIAGSIPGARATRWVALGALVIVGGVVGLGAPGRPFRHGLVAGFVAALAAIWTQALFLDTYFANNPAYADLEMPLGLSPRLATFVFGPLNAIVAGLLTGLAAWSSRKVVDARRESGS